MLKKKKIYPAYVSKHKSNWEKQFILLMVTNLEGWHYLAVKKLSALLWRITSKHHDDFCYLNGLHSFATENKCESLSKDFCNVVIPSKNTTTLELYQYQRFDKVQLLFMQILNV